VKSERIVKLFLADGADLEAKDAGAKTALELARELKKPLTVALIENHMKK